MSEWERHIRLANGSVWPLEQVSACFGLLEALQADAATRAQVYDLRQACFGLDLAPERQAALARTSAVATDGAVSAVMKDVVLSSVRGEGTGVYLASPFTDTWDRSLHELRAATDRVRGRLPADEARRLIEDDPLQRGLDALRDTPDRWRDLVRRPAPPSPPPDFTG